MDLQQQLAAMQAELDSSQQQLLEVSTQLAAAEQAKAALQEQLEHLGVKVRGRGIVIWLQDAALHVWHVLKMQLL